MARRQATLPARRRARRKPRKTSASVKRPKARAKPAHKPAARKRSRTVPKRPVRKTAAPPRTTAKARPAGRTKIPRLDRVRRTLEETVQTPPSSLDMDRHGSAARTGRAEMAEALQEHAGMSPAITGGDVDANWADAYFSGDEAPGGDNPTPDQDVVEEIGKALGVEYQDNEELKASEKVVARDRHRWELDPASSEDYKERK